MSNNDKSQQARQFWEEQARRFDDFYPLIAQLLRDRGTSAWLAAECDRLTADLKTLQSANTALLRQAVELFEGDDECQRVGTDAWTWLQASRQYVVVPK